MNQTYPAVSDIKAFFFDAALYTYAGDTPKTTIRDLPHSKVYRHSRGSFLYTDSYFTNGDLSGGQTVIHYDEEPVWIMQYQGVCQGDDPDVLKFLKRVLARAYDRRVFVGGRGRNSLSSDSDLLPAESSRRNFSYTNEVLNEQKEPFRQFRGHERIDEVTVEAGIRTIFWHRYQGMLLIPEEAPAEK